MWRRSLKKERPRPAPASQSSYSNKYRSHRRVSMRRAVSPQSHIPRRGNSADRLRTLIFGYVAPGSAGWRVGGQTTPFRFGGPTLPNFSRVGYSVVVLGLFWGRAAGEAMRYKTHSATPPRNMFVARLRAKVERG